MLQYTLLLLSLRSWITLLFLMLQGQTALYQAAQAQRLAVVEQLLLLGAEYTVADTVVSCGFVVRLHAMDMFWLVLSQVCCHISALVLMLKFLIAGPAAFCSVQRGSSHNCSSYPKPSIL